MADEKKQQSSDRRAVIPTNQYRTIYANTFTISASDNDIAVGFGILSETLGHPTPQQIFQEVTIALTHRSAKAFAKSLLSTIEQIEKEQGPIKAPALDLEPTEAKVTLPIGSPEQ